MTTEQALEKAKEYITLFDSMTPTHTEDSGSASHSNPPDGKILITYAESNRSSALVLWAIWNDILTKDLSQEREKMKEKVMECLKKCQDENSNIEIIYSQIEILKARLSDLIEKE